MTKSMLFFDVRIKIESSCVEPYLCKSKYINTHTPPGTIELYYIPSKINFKSLQHDRSYSDFVLLPAQWQQSQTYFNILSGSWYKFNDAGCNFLNYFQYYEHQLWTIILLGQKS